MLKTIDSISGKNQRILLRLDLNVPMENGKVGDDTRIREAVPTVSFLLNQGAKLILMSHLGRPKGWDLTLSLKPLIPDLERLFKTRVHFFEDAWDASLVAMTHSLPEGEILLLENIRFHPEEERNDADFSKQMAELGDLYVNDAFGTLHRAHASTEGVTHFLPAHAGFLVQKEVEVLGRVVKNPERPFALVVGGAKIDTKIGILEHFLGLVDQVLIGGALSTTFLAAQGHSVGASLFEPDQLETARRFLREAEDRGVRVHLPVDLVVSETITQDSVTQMVKPDAVLPDHKILDIGTATQDGFARIIREMATVVWNGPMGLYELNPFAGGTRAVAQACSNCPGLTVLGGGDTVDAIHHFGMNEQSFSHVSTGGGAMLEFLEGKPLPALERLMQEGV